MIIYCIILLIRVFEKIILEVTNMLSRFTIKDLAVNRVAIRTYYRRYEMRSVRKELRAKVTIRESITVEYEIVILSTYGVSVKEKQSNKGLSSAPKESSTDIRKTEQRIPLSERNGKIFVNDIDRFDRFINDLNSNNKVDNIKKSALNNLSAAENRFKNRWKEWKKSDSRKKYST